MITIAVHQDRLDISYTISRLSVYRRRNVRNEICPEIRFLNSCQRNGVLRPRPRIPFTDWIWHQLFIAASRRRERERRRARAAVINTADFPSVCCCIWKFSTGLPPQTSSHPFHRSCTSMFDRRIINKKTDLPRNFLVHGSLERCCQTWKSPHAKAEEKLRNK